MKHLDKPDTFGKCIACPTDTASTIEGRLQTNEHYREHRFKLSNKSSMRVAFCEKCIEQVKEKDFGWIMQNIIAGWDYSLNSKNKTEEEKEKYRKNFFSLKIVDFA